MVIRIYVCIYDRCMHACMYACIYDKCMHVCIYVCIYACIYDRCMHACMYACIYDKCMHVCIYVCMHVCMHVSAGMYIKGLWSSGSVDKNEEEIPWPLGDTRANDVHCTLKVPTAHAGSANVAAPSDKI